MARYIVIALPDNENLEDLADQIADTLSLAQVTHDLIAPVEASDIQTLVDQYPPPEDWKELE